MLRSEESQKRQIVQNMFDTGRVYFFPEQTQTGFVLTTNLSTALLTCLQDLRNPQRLEHIIDVAMEYPLTTVDTEVLEAISRLRKDFNPKDYSDNKYTYNLLALYCFLADMVTLYPNHCNPDGTSKTFLQACRDAKLTLKPNTEIDLTDYRTRFVNVLEDLGLANRLPQNFLQNWIWNWNFSAFGEINSAENIADSAYNKLAQAISYMGGSHIGVGECICYARGNRDHFEKENTKIAEEPNLNEIMLSRARNLAGSTNYLPQLIERGKKLREDKLHQLVRENTELQHLHVIGQNDFDVNFGKNYMRNLLMALPLETLQLLDSSDFAIAHVNSYNLEKIYPRQTLPGLLPEQMEAGRLAAGDTMSRFRLICNSNGLFHNTTDLKTLSDALKQRLIHETAHIAFGNHGARSLDEPFYSAGYAKKFGDLSKKFSAICEKLFLEPDSMLDQESRLLRYLTNNRTVKQRTFRDVINSKSDIGTYSPPERAEEMMVECLALSCVEFNSDDPNNIFQNYRSDNLLFADFQTTLREIRTLYSEISTTSVQAAEMQRQKETQRT